VSRDLRIMACVFCKDKTFREWVATQVGACGTEDQAKAFILERCEVDSRTELDVGPAAERFHSRVRKPYLKWKEPA
jgi:hypothetical protein